MRDRTFRTLLAVTVTTVLLTGCTAGADTVTEPEVAHPVDLCSLAAPSGGVSDAVIVDGTVGSPATVSFTGPRTIPSTERTVIVEGDGEPVDSASLVEYAMTVFDAATGEQLQAQGYDDTPMLPVPAISLGQLLGCAPVGSRIVVAVPETDQEGATVRVLDLLSVQPSRATGDEQKPVEGMPIVELAQSGAPTVTIPNAEPPADTSVAVLRMGDGTIVAAGDTVMVQYTAVRWSDGTVIDSSWSTGAPTVLVTTEVIAGYREALEGQAVGSQVLVVIPPKFAYGEGQINEQDLTGETLVLVVDILATMPTP